MSEPANETEQAMSTGAAPRSPAAKHASPHRTPEAEARVRRRVRFEVWFRRLGMLAILFGLLCVVLLFGSIISQGYSALQQTEVRLDIEYDPQVLGVQPGASAEELGRADFAALIRASLKREFPGVEDRLERKQLNALVSSSAGHELRRNLLKDPSLLGQQRSYWFTADDDVDMLIKGHSRADVPEAERVLKDKQIAWVVELQRRGRVQKAFNTTFFSGGDSREPEQAGILGAVMGSFYTLLVTLLLSFPLGVATAVYLEEFAPKSRWLDWVEVNINNLAAIPSIVFGLLGLAVFINAFNLPRSAPVVAGLVLTLMTLPVVIIASRAAIQSVPPSIRAAALGMGASQVQTVLHHVLPLALPGMLTGTIIGMARALGETAPLLMIGMVAFVVDVPKGIFEPATALPVQIYLWADSPERGFAERTSAAIAVLILFLMAMNAVAVILRKRFEMRW
jgi:phosphate transport system permease protein